MLTLSWRRFGSSSTLVLALVVGLPALAQAQLFPNLFIQRQRTECVNEPPFYKHVRRDFYGYYPTCWRRFPEGWACPCPNPELPDRERSFRERPADDKKNLQPPDDLDRNPPTDDREMDGGVRPTPGGGAGGAGRSGTDPNLPALPNTTRSPFEIDPKRPAVPNNPDVDDPFLNPSVPGSARPNAGPRPGSRIDPSTVPPQDGPNANTSPSDSSPILNGPANSRPQEGSVRTSSTSAETAIPVLALPEMSAPSPTLPTDSPVLSNLPASLPTNGAFLESAIPASADPATTVTPAQAPRRTSMIGSLFGLRNRAQR